MMSISNFYARVFALAVVLALSYLLAQIFAPFVGSMLWAAFLAFLLHPVYTNLRRRFGNRAGLAAGVLTGLTPVVVLMPLVALSIAFVAQVSQLLRVLQVTAVRWDIKGLADLKRMRPSLQIRFKLGWSVALKRSYKRRRVWADRCSSAPWAR
jgi:predicted PurR-regulated permease PerM